NTAPRWPRRLRTPSREPRPPPGPPGVWGRHGRAVVWPVADRCRPFARPERPAHAPAGLGVPALPPGFGAPLRSGKKRQAACWRPRSARGARKVFLVVRTLLGPHGGALAAPAPQALLSRFLAGKEGRRVGWRLPVSRPMRDQRRR